MSTLLECCLSTEDTELLAHMENEKSQYFALLKYCDERANWQNSDFERRVAEYEAAAYMSEILLPDILDKQLRMILKAICARQPHNGVLTITYSPPKLYIHLESKSQTERKCYIADGVEELFRCLEQNACYLHEEHT